MATDHEGYMRSWSFHGIPSFQRQSVPEDMRISELLDNSSISLGKYATETLAWEKWSVFSHNRCLEELEKFRAPGLVAQKKAYFEEYYKKIRAMKEMQSDQPDSNSGSLQLAFCSPEKKLDKLSNTPNSARNSLQGGAVGESRKFAEKGDISGVNGLRDRSSMEGKMNGSSSRSVKRISTALTPTSHSSRSTQRSSFSDKVDAEVGQLRRQTSDPQDKGIVGDVKYRTNSDSSRSTKNNVKQSTYKDDKSCLTRKSSDLKAEIIRQARTGSADQNSSLVRDKLVSPSGSKELRRDSTKTTSKSLVEKSVTKSANKLVPPLTEKASRVKTSTVTKGVVEKSLKRLPGHSPSAKSMTTVAGSPLSRRSTGLSGQKTSKQKATQDEGEGKSSASPGREPKASLSTRLKIDSTSIASRLAAGPAAACKPTAVSSNKLKRDSTALSSNAAKPTATKPVAVLSAKEAKPTVTSKLAAAKAAKQMATSKPAAVLSAKEAKLTATSKPAAALSAKEARQTATSKPEAVFADKAARPTATSKPVVALTSKAAKPTATSKPAATISAKVAKPTAARKPTALLSAILVKPRKLTTALSPKAAKHMTASKSLATLSTKANKPMVASKPTATLSSKAVKPTTTSKPTTALSAKAKNDTGAAITKDPKAATSPSPRKDSNAAVASSIILGTTSASTVTSAQIKRVTSAAKLEEPKTALQLKLEKDSKAAIPSTTTLVTLVTSEIKTTTHRNALLTQKIVPCRSPDPLHDLRAPTPSRVH